MNTLPKVTLRSDESGEQLLRRFSREVVKSRVLTDVRRKRWFVSKSELNRIDGKLSNEGFLAKAPAAVLEQQKARRAEVTEKMAAIRGQIEYFAKL